MKSWKGALGGVVVLIVIVVVGMFTMRGCSVMLGLSDYSSGYRDGYVQKVTTKGRMVKFWEIEMGFHGYGTRDLSGKEGQGAGGVWIANFEDPTIGEHLKKIRGDELVRIHYEEKYFQFLQSTGYSITKVERLDETLPKNRE